MILERLVKKQAESFNFTKINTGPWMFFKS